MMDLDHFKRVNDKFGHPFGDLVLESAAQAISETVREYDIAARYGGEEFAVVVSETTSQDMVALAERIRERVAALEISDQQNSTRITISIGVAAMGEGDTTETLLKRADNALYLAKSQGRNKTVLL